VVLNGGLEPPRVGAFDGLVIDLWSSPR
jgi:hypothetical protein